MRFLHIFAYNGRDYAFVCKSMSFYIEARGQDRCGGYTFLVFPPSRPALRGCLFTASGGSTLEEGCKKRRGVVRTLCKRAPVFAGAPVRGLFVLYPAYGQESPQSVFHGHGSFRQRIPYGGSQARSGKNALFAHGKCHVHQFLGLGFKIFARISLYFYAFSHFQAPWRLEQAAEAHLPQTRHHLSPKVIEQDRPSGNKPSCSLQNHAQRHRVHASCGMPIWTPCCAQQLGQLFFLDTKPPTFLRAVS